ncbi:hypothetical protein [Desulfovibrio ferrophilus]|uniref:Integral membrane sensor signal transduction histidine kinase n=1 Tax=Desulfovibrio ferrophilus TaxID=241368 RepID=A0A2Z6B0Y7_9BACT|nr:hypothetical protein [Desulfovibrio ferrophilus]BBD09171.1 integral membrane sensor signal transduction histidine kinase [Desulfovibrio ferrophilus]
MQLDLFTILGIESAICLLFGIWLLLYSFLTQPFPGTRWSALAYLLWGICTLLSAARGNLPDNLTLFVAHALLAIGMACYHEGLLRLLRAPRQLPGIGLVLASIEIFSAYYFGIHQDDLQTRIIISCIVLIIFSLLGIFRIREFGTASGDMVIHLRITTLFLMVVAVASIIRITINVLSPMPAGRLIAGALQAAPHIAYLIFFMGSALNLTWMSLRLHDQFPPDASSHC